MRYCAFRNIGIGIKALNSQVKIGFCTFDGVIGDAVLRPAQTKENAPWFTFKESTELMPVLGDQGDEESGRNTFSSELNRIGEA